jgi:hypothetical protein
MDSDTLRRERLNKLEAKLEACEIEYEELRRKTNSSFTDADGRVQAIRRRRDLELEMAVIRTAIDALFRANAR